MTPQELTLAVAKVICTKFVRFERCAQKHSVIAPCSLKNCPVIPVAVAVIAMVKGDDA